MQLSFIHTYVNLLIWALGFLGVHNIDPNLKAAYVDVIRIIVPSIIIEVIALFILVLLFQLLEKDQVVNSCLSCIPSREGCLSCCIPSREGCLSCCIPSKEGCLSCCIPSNEGCLSCCIPFTESCLSCCVRSTEGCLSCCIRSAEACLSSCVPFTERSIYVLEVEQNPQNTEDLEMTQIP